MKVNRTVFLPLVLLVSFTLSFGQTQNQRGDGPQTPAQGEEIWQIAQRLPVAPQGQSGPAVYVIAYSTCPYTAAFWHDYGGKLNNLELRWMFYPIDAAATADATGDLAATKDANVLTALLNHSRIPPSVRSSPDRVAAYNDVVARMSEMNNHFARFHQYHIISPTFIWRDNKGQVFVVRGYSKDTFERIMLPSMLGQR